MRIRAVVSSCSLLVAAWAMPQSYKALHRDLERSPDTVARALLESRISEESDLYEKVRRMKAADLPNLRKAVAVRARAETVAEARDPGMAAKAAKLKSANPMYRDDGEKEASNWLAKAYERLGRALGALLRRETPKGPDLNLGGTNLQGLSFLMWGLLGAVLVTFLYFVFRHFTWQGKLKRKAALLDADEPERTLDEWLTLADQLEREGKYREAVRCLYLACLLKFDEHHVARFDRGQTNWEHLKRIDASPAKPAGLEFRPATQAFDRVWYGMIVEGRADVDRFRQWYKDVVAAVGVAK